MSFNIDELSIEEQNSINNLYNKYPHIPPSVFNITSSISKVLPIYICTSSIVIDTIKAKKLGNIIFLLFKYKDE